MIKQWLIEFMIGVVVTTSLLTLCVTLAEAQTTPINLIDPTPSNIPAIGHDLVSGYEPIHISKDNIPLDTLIVQMTSELKKLNEKLKWLPLDIKGNLLCKEIKK